MKAIKGILIALLSLVLLNIIFALAISFSFKKVLINGVMKEVVKEQIIPNSFKSEESKVTEEQIKEITDDPKVQEVLNSPEVQELYEKYLDATVEGLIDSDNMDDISIEEDVVEFIKNNREVIEEKAGKEITDEMIEDAAKQVESQDMTKAYKQSLKNASQNMDPKTKGVLKSYKFLVSLKFKIILLIALLVDLLLIALLQKSVYKWLKTYGKTAIIGGICIIIAGVTSSFLIKIIAEIEKFDTSSLTISGLVALATGIISIVIYKIVSKKVEEDDNHEVSKVPREE